MPRPEGKPESPARHVAFGPRPTLLALLAAAAGAAGTAALLAVRANDRAGGLLLAGGALLLAATALRGALMRPVLVAGVAGLTVRDGLRLVHLPWGEDLVVEVMSARVRLLRTEWVEVRSEVTVVLVPRWQLGVPAAVAVAAVAAARVSAPQVPEPPQGNP